ncbi:hypothetical protein COB28_01420 [Candidatus Dependentiae bacterium]|nr:MAG: hypothetical protein COB28_01420 [Candidatus Dependentiae bacterium]
MNNITYGFQCRGIVVKRFFPHSSKLHIFDEEQGLISLHLSDVTLLHRLWPGMHVAYSYLEKKGNKYISLIDILLVPISSSYQMLQKLQRLIKVCNVCLQKNIPHKKNYSLLLIGLHSFVEDIVLFGDIELWISALILQDAGYWNKDLFLVINKFLMKLSVLIDSFIQHEVELFQEWLSVINRNYAEVLEMWIETCLNEQVYYEK